MKRLLLSLCVLLAACVVPGPRTPTPPAPTTFTLTVEVVDERSEQPLVGSHAYRDNNMDVAVFVGDAGRVSWLLDAAGFNVCARATAHLTRCLPVSEVRDQTIRLALTPEAVVVPVPPEPTRPVVVWPPARPRSQLPEFPAITSTGDGVWSSGPYDRTIPFPVPSRPDIDFHRGNFSGIRVPECHLPQLEAGIAGHPEHVMTWDQPQYAPADQACVLNAYANVRGYTHFTMSIPQARNHGVLDQRLLDAAVLAKQYNQFVVMIVYGGDGESFGDVLPWLEKLVALHAVDELSVCWQCDFRYDPFELVSRTQELGEWAHAHGLKVSQHWVNEALAWWNAADEGGTRKNTCLDSADLGLPPICNRFDYHRVMAQYVDYQYHQGDTGAAINDDRTGGYQGSIGDVLRSLTTEKLVIAEYDAQREFDDPDHATEDQGDLKGYLLMCTQRNGAFVLGGYMNGARLPNGSVF